MKMKIFFTAMLAAVFLSACKTVTTVVSERRQIEIAYNPAMRQLRIDGRERPPFALDEIAKVLKAEKITPEQELSIIVPNVADKRVVSELVSHFSKAGFSRYTFCTESVAESYSAMVAFVYYPREQAFYFTDFDRPPFALRDILAALKDANISTDSELRFQGVDDDRLATELSTILKNAGYRYNFALGLQTPFRSTATHEPLPQTQRPRVNNIRR